MRRRGSRSSLSSTIRTSTRRSRCMRAIRQATRRPWGSSIARSRGGSRAAESRLTTASCSASCRPSPPPRPTWPSRHRPRIFWPPSCESTAISGARTTRRLPTCRRNVAGVALDGRLPAARQRVGRVRVRRQPDLLLSGRGNRPAGAPRVRPGRDAAHPDSYRERGCRSPRRRSRHLRQLRDRRSWPRRPVSLRTSFLDRRQRRRSCGTGARARTKRHDRAGGAGITCTSRCSSTATR